MAPLPLLPQYLYQQDFRLTGIRDALGKNFRRLEQLLPPRPEPSLRTTYCRRYRGAKGLHPRSAAGKRDLCCLSTGINLLHCVVWCAPRRIVTFLESFLEEGQFGYHASAAWTVTSTSFQRPGPPAPRKYPPGGPPGAASAEPGRAPSFRIPLQEAWRLRVASSIKRAAVGSTVFDDHSRPSPGIGEIYGFPLAYLPAGGAFQA